MCRKINRLSLGNRLTQAIERRGKQAEFRNRLLLPFVKLNNEKFDTCQPEAMRLVIILQLRHLCASWTPAPRRLDLYSHQDSLNPSKAFTVVWVWFVPPEADEHSQLGGVILKLGSLWEVEPHRRKWVLRDRPWGFPLGLLPVCSPGL